MSKVAIQSHTKVLQQFAEEFKIDVRHQDLASSLPYRWKLFSETSPNDLKVIYLGAAEMIELDCLPEVKQLDYLHSKLLIALLDTEVMRQG